MARCQSLVSTEHGFKEIAQMSMMSLGESGSESSESENEIDCILDMLANGNIHEIANFENNASSEDSESYSYESDSEIDYIADLKLNEIKVEKHDVSFTPTNNENINVDIHNSTSTNKVSTCLPARNNWDGAHYFKIQLTYNVSMKCSDSAIYSQARNKLYINKDLEFRICCSAVDVPNGSVVRATAVFSLPEQAFEVVKRCRIHAQEDILKGNPAYEHVIQSTESEAVYEKDSLTGQCSVVIPYKQLNDEDDVNTYIYKLTCFNSCPGGLNRRPFLIQFTLENNNLILGRQTLHVRVCASPIRDLKTEAKKSIKLQSFHSETNSTNPKQLVLVDPKQTTSTYTITMKDPRLYKFLMHMKAFYESSSYAKYLLITEGCQST